MDGRRQPDVANEGLPAAAVEVLVEDIEVVQAIQEPDHSVTLIAQKQTIARVYLGTNSDTPVEVRGVMTATRSGGGPPLRAPSLNTVTIDPAQNGDIQSKRENVEHSLNFALPDAATVSGNSTLELVSVSAPQTGAAYDLKGSRSCSVDFVPGAPLRLRLLGIRYRTANSTQTFVPTQRDVDLIFSWLRRAYPIAELDATYAVIDANRPWPFTASQINAQLAAVRRQDLAAGTDQRTHYYGVVSDGGNNSQFMRGRASGIPATADPSVVASGPTGDFSFNWDFDGVFGDWYTAHELGHAFGCRHPGFCDQPVDDTDYPYANGQLADGSSPAFVGLDVGDSSGQIPMAALPGTHWHDVMTYCEGQWLSDYTYEIIRLRLHAEDALGPGTQVDGAGLELIAVAPAQRHVNVIATLNLTTGSGNIEYVQPVASDAATERAPDADGEATLQVTDSSGTVIAEHAVAIRIESCSDNQDKTASLDVVIPLPQDATGLLLVYQNTVIARFERRGKPSDVSSIRASHDADATVEGLTWDSAEASDPGVTYTVQISRDDGRRWETIAVGRPDPSVALEPADYPGLQSVRVRVIATDGFENTSVSEADVALD